MLRRCRTRQVEAVLGGARNDLTFVPVAIDYEKVVESSSYSKELAGGEKKPEDLKALLTAPKVLTARYGRIYVTFDEPLSLADLMKSRGLPPGEPVTEEQKKGLVRAGAGPVDFEVTPVDCEGCFSMSFTYADPKKIFQWVADLSTDHAHFTGDLGTGRTTLDAGAHFLAPEAALSEAMFF